MRMVSLVLFIALLVCSAFGCTGTSSDQVTVGLYGRGYRFQGDSSPVAELAADKCEGFLDAGTGKLESFTLKLSVSVTFPFKDANLLEIPGLLCVKLRQHDPSDWGRQNYPSFPMPDGTVPVLEASLDLGQDMTVGTPLAVLDNPDGIKLAELAAQYSDGVIFSSKDVDPAISDFCSGNGKKVLPFNEKAMEDGSYIDEYASFYDLLQE